MKIKRVKEFVQAAFDKLPQTRSELMTFALAGGCIFLVSYMAHLMLRQVGSQFVLPEPYNLLFFTVVGIVSGFQAMYEERRRY
jgi:hypothetical protein